MTLNHWQEIAWSEHSHAHHIDTFPALFKEEKLGHESSSVEKKTDPLRPALIERLDVEKHEIYKIDIDRPNIEKMELNKPGIERPEIEKLETSKPDIDRPEVEKF